MAWYDAVDVCKTEAPNGHLVSVNSEAEQQYLVTVINSDTCKIFSSYVWLKTMCYVL